MHSSTFNSESDTVAAPGRIVHAYRVWSVCALLSLVLFCLGIEVLARFGFAHVSRIEARISSDHAAVLAIRKNDKPSVLLIGNSLLLEDINAARLRKSLGGRAYAIPFPIEETEYLDWFYGLRRIFAEGSRPDMVVLCINSSHLTSFRVRGDYSVYYLFNLLDIPAISRRVHYDLTKASGLVLSRFSLFYAARNNLRNFVLIRAAPSYAEMQRLSAVSQAQFPSNQQLQQIAAARLSEMRTLCSSYGAKFVFLLPPGFGSDEAALVQAGTRSETDLLIPVHLNALGRDKFKDGLHLNASGARIFTDEFSALLQSRFLHP